MPTLSHVTVRGGRVTTVVRTIPLVGPRAGGHAVLGRDRRPAEALAERMRAMRPEQPFRYGMELLAPYVIGTANWYRPADVLAEMLARPGQHRHVSPDVSAARIAISLAHAALGRPAVGLALARRAVHVGPDSLLLRLDADGLVEQAAVSDPAVGMLPHDPMSSHPDARVLPDQAALTGRLADQVLATLHPLIEDLHRRTRCGVVSMWTLAADAALGPVTVVPLPAGFQQESGRRVATTTVDALIAALVERGAPIPSATLRDRIQD